MLNDVQNIAKAHKLVAYDYCCYHNIMTIRPVMYIRNEIFDIVKVHV